MKKDKLQNQPSDDVTILVKQGCKEFKGKDIDKIRQELEPLQKP